MDEYQHLKRDPLYYLDPQHHPHERDQYTFASQAITSIIRVFDRTSMCDDAVEEQVTKISTIANDDVITGL
ncbi:hypothetical protein BDR06DRAFT_403517 [Suillus hirtellus]|nr:hypothetical protein BDR06DRAFT_403517 [Suillus hirtellus]